MRIARRLVLLSATVMAIMALGASSAAANSGIAMSEEGGDNCNPCVLLLYGESELRAITVLVSRCEDTFEVWLNHNGTGSMLYTNEPHHFSVGPGCTRRPCNGTGEPAVEHPFPILGTEEIAEDVAEMSIRLCLDSASNPNGTGQHCTADVFVDDLGSHDYRLTTHQTCFGGLAELRGTWFAVTDANHDNLDIGHL